jgi:hypothetical protein
VVLAILLINLGVANPKLSLGRIGKKILIPHFGTKTEGNRPKFEKSLTFDPSLGRRLKISGLSLNFEIL